MAKIADISEAKIYLRKCLICLAVPYCKCKTLTNPTTSIKPRKGSNEDG